LIIRSIRIRNTKKIRSIALRGDRKSKFLTDRQESGADNDLTRRQDSHDRSSAIVRFSGKRPVVP